MADPRKIDYMRIGDASEYIVYLRTLREILDRASREGDHRNRVRHLNTRDEVDIEIREASFDD